MNRPTGDLGSFLNLCSLERACRREAFQDVWGGGVYLPALKLNLKKLALGSNGHIAEISDERLVSQLLG